MDFLATLIIRPESPRDAAGIWALNQSAFGRDDEANLVDNLRSANAVTLSLVAKTGQVILGHILFSPMKITNGSQEIPAVGLGPMAVRPDFQRRGMGSNLVNTGLMTLRERGHSIVIVLGHPWFYPKFGFEPAINHGITWDRPVSPEVFMVQALQPGALEGVKGTAHYHSAFEGV